MATRTSAYADGDREDRAAHSGSNGVAGAISPRPAKRPRLGGGYDSDSSYGEPDSEVDSELQSDASADTTRVHHGRLAVKYRVKANKSKNNYKDPNHGTVREKYWDKKAEYHAHLAHTIAVACSDKRPLPDWFVRRRPPTPPLNPNLPVPPASPGPGE